jgi:hypothetical protein
MDEANIEKIIARIVAAYLEAITKKVDTIQSTVDTKFSAWDETTSDFSTMKVNMGKLEAQMGGVRDDIENLSKKLINRVDEHLEPVPQMVCDSVKKNINSKSVIDKIKEKINQ